MENKKEFDQFANNYKSILADQLNFFQKDIDYFSEYKVLKLKSLLNTKPSHILDFGCGVGLSCRLLAKHFEDAHIYGCDVSEESLAQAQINCPTVNFFTNDTQNFCQVFDVIFVSNVFHHINPKNRNAQFENILRMLRKNGHIIIFEHNPFNPLTRHLVNTCPFDKDAVLLKPNELYDLFNKHGMKSIQRQYTLFFPEFLKVLRGLEKYLTWVPLGGQYLMFGQA